MRRLTKKAAIIGWIVLSLLLLVSCESGSSSGSLTEEADFSITFIDVGQGDAALVSCDGHYMLIDGGPTGAGDDVRNVLMDNNVTKLDYLIISHMHKDHIGGLKKALSYVSVVGKTLSVEGEDDSDEYYDFHVELLADGCNSIDVPKEGERFSLGKATIEVIAVGDPSVNKNDSLVVLITYKNTTFLFPGDMQSQGEKGIYDNLADCSPITLLKVAHHGSSTSTTDDFIKKIKPKYAVVSVGVNNQWKHPSDTVLNSLKEEKVKVYRTDENGSITVTSDGKKLTIQTEK